MLFLVLIVLGVSLRRLGDLGQGAVDRFYLDALSIEAAGLRIARYVGPALAAIGIGGFLGSIS